MCIQFLQITLHVGCMFIYSTWTLFTLFTHFPISFLKRSEEDAFLVFSGTSFHIWGPLYVTVSVPYFTILLFVKYRHWKFLKLWLLFLIIKAPFIIGGAFMIRNHNYKHSAFDFNRNHRIESAVLRCFIKKCSGNFCCRTIPDDCSWNEVFQS